MVIVSWIPSVGVPPHSLQLGLVLRVKWILLDCIQTPFNFLFRVSRKHLNLGWFQTAMTFHPLLPFLQTTAASHGLATLMVNLMDFLWMWDMGLHMIISMVMVLRRRCWKLLLVLPTSLFLACLLVLNQNHKGCTRVWHTSRLILQHHWLKKGGRKKMVHLLDTCSMFWLCW